MIGIVGAGAFGTALAVAWGREGRPILLWGRDAAAMARREMPRLPGVTLPDAVTTTSDARRLADCPVLVFAVPLQRLADAGRALPPMAPADVVAACKGVEARTLRGPTAILAGTFPQANHAILSGPSFAADIARGLPTALSLGGGNLDLQTALSTRALRLYRTDDVRGVELGGALKNVVAIACGAAIGAGLGESARAAVMTRGMAETMRLADAMGARRETLMGLSGLGDLALTCASPQSRNFALGLALGRRAPPAEATTEGVATAAAALALARDRGIEMPVTQAVAGLVAGKLTVEDAMGDLLARDLRTE